MENVEGSPHLGAHRLLIFRLRPDCGHRSYASEEREGGTPALGAGIPAISRGQWSVFTPEQWEREKDRLIYESWLKAARAPLSSAP